MVALGVGEVTAATFAEACDIVISETGDLPHIPQLSARGPWYDPVGRTTALVDGLHVDVRSRGWVVTPRGSRAANRAKDGFDRDIDTVEELWPSHVDTVKVHCLGPWSLATKMELANGHRVLSDRSATIDISEALTAGLVAHAKDIARRFSSSRIVVQFDEPYLGSIRAGAVPGTSDFDTLRPVPVDELQRVLFPAYEAVRAAVDEQVAYVPVINQIGYAPQWDVMPSEGALIDLAFVTNSAQLDAAGTALEELADTGGHCAVSANRDELERVCSELGQDRGVFDIWARGGAEAYRTAYELDRFIR